MTNIEMANSLTVPANQYCVLVRIHSISSTYTYANCPQVLVMAFFYIRKSWIWVSKALGSFDIASSTHNQKLSLRRSQELVVRNLMDGREVTENV